MPGTTRSARRRGPAERQLEAAGRRAAAVIRLVALVPTVLVALGAGLTASPGVPVPLLAAVVAALVTEGLAYAWWVRARPRPLLVALDATFLGVVALATAWIVPPSWLTAGTSWLVPFLAFAGVGYQYSARRPVALVAALGLTAAAATGAALALPPDATRSTVVSSVWAGAIALLAALLWALVRRGAARADARREELAEAERERDVAAALRRDERALVAALHDTAASTLLVVGLGDVPADPRRVAERARRDLAAMAGLDDGPAPAGDDLVAALHTLAAQTAMEVALHVADPPPVLPAPVHDAVTRAVSEALANAATHSGASTAAVTVTGHGGAVVVTVVDRGRGFDPTSVPVTRRGVRHSIQGRMAAVGGHARVNSAAGVGTTVVLEWAP